MARQIREVEVCCPNCASAGLKHELYWDIQTGYGSCTVCETGYDSRLVNGIDFNWPQGTETKQVEFDA